MTGILWLKSPQKSGYGSLNASKVSYKWYLTILEERGKTKTPTETFDPWWKHEELSLYSSAYFPWQCSGRWVVCEEYYWTTKISIERTERLGGDCSHQGQMARMGGLYQRVGIQLRARVQPGIRNTKFECTQAICVWFLTLLKTHVQEWMPSLLVLNLNQKEKQFLNKSFFRKDLLNRLISVHLVRLFYILWGYGSVKNQPFNM